MITVGSDFSGVGAFNQALKRLGIEYNEIFACDMDKYARQTFIHNYGEPKYYPKNVYERDIPNQSLDIYMTSPPCQSFSLAGKRLGKNDKRGILFFNSLEFIQENKPRFFIFENVKGLLSDNGGRTFSEWVNFLGGKSVNGAPVLFPYVDSVPYHLYWKVLNAKHHGVPQNRERVFLIGIRDDVDNNFNFPAEEHLTKRLKDVLEEEVDEKHFLSESQIENIIKSGFTQEKERIQNGDYSGTLLSRNYKSPKCVPVLTPNRIEKRQNGRRFKKDGEPAFTVTCQDYHGVYDGCKIRRLTPRECFRLMDFPDTFTWPVSDSQAYKQAGNSIVVNVLYKILKNLKKL
jgi:DNA (cytosine-5)-methyltransferase 1